MKLWLLKPKEDLPDVYGTPQYDLKVNPWNPWYDKIFGFVIRAESEKLARAIAQEVGGYETLGGKIPAWTDANLSTCVELPSDGEPGMILHEPNDA